ncbi:MAG: hypothetical protein ABFS22_12005 [Pseudomonadota bacterium]
MGDRIAVLYSPGFDRALVALAGAIETKMERLEEILADNVLEASEDALLDQIGDDLEDDQGSLQVVS